VLSLALLVAHVTVTVLDDWVEIGWADAVMPFRAGYRPVWTGLGTVAALLLLTAALTAGARRLLPLAFWRRTHYLTHAAWPVAVVHGLGAGSDRASAGAVGLTLGCVALVTFATVLRFTGATGHRWGGVAARVAAVVLPVALGAWLGSTGALR
jgi:sulfoxide reductase heme-binding subunit YedZ